MNLDKFKEMIGKFNAQDLPAGAAALAGIVLLFLVFKTGKFFTRLVFFLIGIGLFAGAYWWHTHK